MADLPPLPVTSLAIHIALNGVTLWFLMPFIETWLRRRLTLRGFVGLMAFSIAFGLLLSNFSLWLIMWAATPGVK